MSDPVQMQEHEEPRYRLLRPGVVPIRSDDAVGPRGFTRREDRRLETIQRMIDRLEHRAVDPTFRKSGYMLAELSALKWVTRILSGNPELPFGAVVQAERTREQRT